MFTILAVVFKSYLGLVSSWSRVHEGTVRWTQENNMYEIYTERGHEEGVGGILKDLEGGKGEVEIM